MLVIVRHVCDIKDSSFGVGAAAIHAREVVVVMDFGEMCRFVLLFLELGHSFVHFGAG